MVSMVSGRLQGLRWPLVASLLLFHFPLRGLLRLDVALLQGRLFLTLLRVSVFILSS